MKYYLGIDIGGTWVKAMLVAAEDICNGSEKVVRVRSRLSEEASVDNFIEALDELLSQLEIPLNQICGIGVSTAGVVNYHGTKLILCAPHLNALKSEKWIQYLKSRTSATIVSLINDADAVAIGAARLKYITGNHTYAVLPIGTGLGCTIVRNGRRWTPNFNLPLLGSIYVPDGCYDKLASASLLEGKSENHNLQSVFTQDNYKEIKQVYLQNISGIIETASLLYGVDRVLIGGGLADAASEHGFADELKNELSKANVVVDIMKEGNKLSLYGALLLAIGESASKELMPDNKYVGLKTEQAYDSSLRLDKMNIKDILNLLNKAEIEAASQLYKSIPQLSMAVEAMLPRIKNGGRLIYVGCGTSGRLAAVDTVELSCTFGFPRERVLTFISGGIADASIDIETNFEEDASSVPDLLIANISENDCVVGISVSGTANYVLSALAYSKSIGAYTIMIQERDITDLPYCDCNIALNTGAEIIAGSTRMKAGTATKKVLNFMSTSLMICLGRVHGTFMTEMECLNNKLVKRAVRILTALYPISEDQALQLLKENSLQLNKTINYIEDAKI